jgi:hypothetical protein
MGISMDFRDNSYGFGFNQVVKANEFDKLLAVGEVVK